MLLGRLGIPKQKQLPELSFLIGVVHHERQQNNFNTNPSPCYGDALLMPNVLSNVPCRGLGIIAYH